MLNDKDKCEIESLLNDQKFLKNWKINENERKIFFDLSLSQWENENFYIYIPEKYKMEMPSIYMISSRKDICYPHIFKSNNLLENDSFKYWLCYINKENIQFCHLELKDILVFVITKMKELLTLYPYQIKEEFQKEFLVLWNNQSDKKVFSYINASNTVKKINLCYHEKNEKNYFWENDTKTLKFSEQVGLGHALYIPVIGLGDFTPPLENKKWTKETIIEFIVCNITDQTLKELNDYILDSNELTILLHVNLGVDYSIQIGLELIFSDNSKMNFIEKLKKIDEFKIIKIERLDKNYLFERVGGTTQLLAKKVLVIGCGSLGSYIVEEIPKLGVYDLTLVDNDNLEVGNIMRHSLGLLYENKNKAQALVLKLGLYFPGIKVSYHDKLIQNLDMNFSDFDLIIFSTGNPNVQRTYNNYFAENKIDVPVIYTWMESGGKAGHALLVRYAEKGCLNCLYAENETNKLNFFGVGEEIKLISNSCGGTFAPYGNIAVMKTSTIALDLIYDALNDSDIKTKGISWIYKENKTNFKYYSDEDIFSEECETCGTR